jgi:hypothetical protein
VEDTIRALVAFGLTLLLVMLRLEAPRFGAAEYSESGNGLSGFRAIWQRLSWYAVGIAGVIAILWIHPDPVGGLRLGTGERGSAIGLGFLLALLGAGQAAGYAYYRYRRIRLPDPESYPSALTNEVATALVDEAAFRGALLGFLLLSGLRPDVAIVIQALIYTLATRLGAPGRDRYRFLLSLGIGLVAGWATVVTGGIGAAFLGHAVTRFSVFLTTGHHGQIAPRGKEVEEVERRRRPPEGWRVIPPRERPARER